jgi:hypothetical protein
LISLLPKLGKPEKIKSKVKVQKLKVKVKAIDVNTKRVLSDWIITDLFKKFN